VSGSGDDRSDQLVPFHFSTSVTTLWPLVEDVPTAVQALGDVHDTPSRVLSVEPAGSGVAWTDHLPPFHTWANGIG
jgi:hypothetical protein